MYLASWFPIHHLSTIWPRARLYLSMCSRAIKTVFRKHSDKIPCKCFFARNFNEDRYRIPLHAFSPPYLAPIERKWFLIVPEEFYMYRLNVWNRYIARVKLKRREGGRGGNICLVIRDGVNTVRFLNWTRITNRYACGMYIFCLIACLYLEIRSSISYPARSCNPESINNNVNNCLFDRSFRSKNGDKIIESF